MFGTSKCCLRPGADTTVALAAGVGLRRPGYSDACCAVSPVLTAGRENSRKTSGFIGLRRRRPATTRKIPWFTVVLPAAVAGRQEPAAERQCASDGL